MSVTFYLNDDRDYSPTLEKWLRQFICTMDEGRLRPGDDSGYAPFGVKIIFDGYADLETYDETYTNIEKINEENQSGIDKLVIENTSYAIDSLDRKSLIILKSIIDKKLGL